MRVRFLLGPSGVGKTWQCLEEARQRLTSAPEGPPLVFLAPKQATFQIERQLLADGPLKGFTRLSIFSFERLAFWLLSELGAHHEFLDQQGRVMLLRSLLGRCAKSLRLFHASAHFQGFAQQLAEALSEFKRHGVAPGHLEAAAGSASDPQQRGKFQDLAFLMRLYADALASKEVFDADDLLPVTTAELRARPGAVRIESLWLDGFADLSPVEAGLLAALGKSSCGEMTLAFNMSGHETEGWLSPWAQSHSVVSRLRQSFCEAGCEVVIERLDRNGRPGRFAGAPVLARIESEWESGVAGAGFDSSQLRIVSCATRDAEAITAAREILRFVREKGGRFRDAAVLTRDLEGCHDAVARTLRQYEIPAFIDRRQPVSHHPLAELTRSALRTIANGWKHDDWFSALKTGLVHPDSGGIDALENAALAGGWEGEIWLKPLQGKAQEHEALRKQLIQPFKQLKKDLGAEPGGGQAADALSEFWNALKIETTLEQWASDHHEPVHTALWQQMQKWLEDLRRAFGSDPIPLSAWLPIIESGLASQSVGLIPPALDQVLVGSIDRSRNPDLRLVIVMGVNEGVFPALPTSPGLLSDWDRRWMRERGLEVGSTVQAQLAREQFYGYIACTRSRERLVLTYSARDSGDAPLKPSRFISRLRQITGAPVETENPEASLDESASLCEAVDALLASGQHDSSGASEILKPALAELQRWGQLRAAPRLDPVLAHRLYPNPLKVSVSSMETFGACPFRFFLHSGLRARERDLFKIDARHQGTFRHEALAAFHAEVRGQNREWRDLTPDEAAELMGQIGERLAENYGGGMLQQSAQARFEAGQITLALQKFIRVAVEWMRASYGFLPAEVELSFGPDKKFEWSIPLKDGRSLSLFGQIDRVDIARDGEARHVVAIDYKSGGESVNDLLAASGVQIQLLAYLAVLSHSPTVAEIFGGPLEPAGFFYVPLSAKLKSEKTRSAARAKIPTEVVKGNFRHAGRFDSTMLPLLASTQPAEHIRCKGASDDGLGRVEFRSLLAQTQITLTAFAERIFEGDCAIAPYKLKSKVACHDCRFEAICRFDSWADSYRKLGEGSGDDTSGGVDE